MNKAELFNYIKERASSESQAIEIYKVFKRSFDAAEKRLNSMEKLYEELEGKLSEIEAQHTLLNDPSLPPDLRYRYLNDAQFHLLVHHLEVVPFFDLEQAVRIIKYKRQQSKAATNS